MRSSDDFFRADARKATGRKQLAGDALELAARFQSLGSLDIVHGMPIRQSTREFKSVDIRHIHTVRMCGFLKDSAMIPIPVFDSAIIIILSVLLPAACWLGVDRSAQPKDRALVSSVTAVVL